MKIISFPYILKFPYSGKKRSFPFFFKIKQQRNNNNNNNNINNGKVKGI